jgi:hypothetical protein
MTGMCHYAQLLLVEMDLANFLPRLASNRNPADLYLPSRRITGLSHHAQLQSPSWLQTHHPLASTSQKLRLWAETTTPGLQWHISLTVQNEVWQWFSFSTANRQFRSCGACFHKINWPFFSSQVNLVYILTLRTPGEKAARLFWTRYPSIFLLLP